MKLQPDKADVQILTAHGPGWVAVNGERVAHSVVVGSREERQAWNCERFEDVGAAHFAVMAEMRTEVDICGRGQRIRFPRPAWTEPLVRKRGGGESVEKAAACQIGRAHACTQVT